MSGRGRRRCAALLALALGGLVGCAPDGPRGGPQGAQQSGAPPVREYRVRGILEGLPAAAGGQLRLRHEAIPELVGPTGEVEGMAAMTMPFPAAEGLDLTGLAAGDPVDVTLRVDWDATPPVVVAAVEPLPPDTALALD